MCSAYQKLEMGSIKWQILGNDDDDKVVNRGLFYVMLACTSTLKISSIVPTKTIKTKKQSPWTIQIFF